MSDVACPECGTKMQLRNSRYGKFFACPRYFVSGCRGTHGAHPDGTPLGKPATVEVKRARIEAHAAFDKLWKSKAMSRAEAYEWLQSAMELPAVDAHIGKFDKLQCEKLNELAKIAISACE